MSKPDWQEAKMCTPGWRRREYRWEGAEWSEGIREVMLVCWAGGLLEGEGQREGERPWDRGGVEGRGRVVLVILLAC